MQVCRHTKRLHRSGLYATYFLQSVQPHYKLPNNAEEGTAFPIMPVPPMTLVTEQKMVQSNILNRLPVLNVDKLNPSLAEEINILSRKRLHGIEI